MDNSVPEAFIFMQLGDYEQESLEGIPRLEGVLDRKNCEVKGAPKRMFWGYGGPFLPVKRVQWFAERWAKQPNSIQVLMQRTASKPSRKCYLYTGHRKEEYSEDNEDWKTIPSEINTDSKFALVLDEIKPCHVHIDLQTFEVGCGGCAGENAAEYVRRRVDKGCFVRARAEEPGAPAQACITYRARLQYPYAVFLR